MPGDVSQQQQETAGGAAQNHCYACGRLLEPGARVCPSCGRRQLRTCFCGNLIPVTAATCPYCGADWSRAYRVRRRSRSRKLKAKYLAGYSAAGALVAVAVAAATNMIVGALAARSLPPGEGLPGSFLARVSLAWQTVRAGVQSVGARISSLGGGPLAVLAVAVAGAGAGAAAYLWRTGWLKLRWLRKRRRVRRKRAGT